MTNRQLTEEIIGFLTSEMTSEEFEAYAKDVLSDPTARPALATALREHLKSLEEWYAEEHYPEALQDIQKTKKYIKILSKMT